MTTIITHADGTIFPTLIEGYESTRDSGNVAHPIVGSDNPDYTLRPAGLRTGTLTLLFADTPASTGYVIEDDYVVPVEIPEQSAEDASLVCETVHASAQVFTLTTADRATILMTYVVRAGGKIIRTLDRDTRSVWLVAVEYQEIRV